MDDFEVWTQKDVDDMLYRWSCAYKDVIKGRLDTLIEWDDQDDKNNFIIELLEGI
jgi:hypothetical protein